MSNGSSVPFAASVWIRSSSSESALSVVLSRRTLLITTAGALICRSAKTPRNSDEHSLPQKARWSKFVKSVVYTITTNAGPPSYNSYRFAFYRLQSETPDDVPFSRSVASGVVDGRRIGIDRSHFSTGIESFGRIRPSRAVVADAAFPAIVGWRVSLIPQTYWLSRMRSLAQSSNFFQAH
jgi:hypothetical protein